MLGAAAWLVTSLPVKAGPQGEAESPAQSTAPAIRPVLSLEDCIQLALRENPSILNALQEIARTRGLKIEVRAQALPQLALNGNLQGEEGGRFEEVIGTGFAIPGIGSVGSGGRQQEVTWQVGVQVQQLVYAGGAVRGAIRVARLLEENALLDLQTTIDSVILEVRRQFYTVLLNQALIAVAAEQVRLLGEELATEQRRLRLGTSTKFNVLRAEVELANARPPLIRARNALRTSLAELAKLIAFDSDPRQPEETPFTVEGELRGARKIYSLPTAMELALRHRSELKSRAKEIQIQKEQLAVDRAGYLPQVSVFGGYDVLGSRFGQFGDSTSGWVGGVQGEWNLFDGLETEGKLQQTRAELQSAEINAADSRRQVELDVRTSHSRLVESVELLDSQAKNVESAQESLRLARARYQAGVGIQLDTLNSQVALTDARVNELQARFDYNVALAELERATGISTSFVDAAGEMLRERRVAVPQLAEVEREVGVEAGPDPRQQPDAIRGPSDQSATRDGSEPEEELIGPVRPPQP